MKRLKRLTPQTFLLAAALLFAACGEKGQGSGASQNAAQNTAQTSPQTATNDVEFAREAFRLLAEGDAAVEEMIDWDNFVSFGDNFGAQYRKANDSGRAQARTDYIKSFSASLKEEGGAAERIVNWREASRESDETVVTADLPSGARLLVTVAGVEGGRKVSSLAAEQPEGQEQEQK